MAEQFPRFHAMGLLNVASTLAYMQEAGTIWAFILPLLAAKAAYGSVRSVSAPAAWCFATAALLRVGAWFLHPTFLDALLSDVGELGDSLARLGPQQGLMDSAQAAMTAFYTKGALHYAALDAALLAVALATLSATLAAATAKTEVDPEAPVPASVPSDSSPAPTSTRRRTTKTPTAGTAADQPAAPAASQAPLATTTWLTDEASLGMLLTAGVLLGVVVAISVHFARAHAGHVPALPPTAPDLLHASAVAAAGILTACGVLAQAQAATFTLQHAAGVPAVQALQAAHGTSKPQAWPVPLTASLLLHALAAAATVACAVHGWAHPLATPRFAMEAPRQPLDWAHRAELLGPGAALTLLVLAGFAGRVPLTSGTARSVLTAAAFATALAGTALPPAMALLPPLRKLLGRVTLTALGRPFMVGTVSGILTGPLVGGASSLLAIATLMVLVQGVSQARALGGLRPFLAHTARKLGLAA